MAFFWEKVHKLSSMTNLWHRRLIPVSTVNNVCPLFIILPKYHIWELIIHGTAIPKLMLTVAVKC